MKKFSWFILICLFIPIFCCCGNNGGNTDKYSETVFETPPKLTVVCTESSVEAMRGTSSWTYKNPDGTSVSVMSDSMHPLEAKEYMNPLKLIPSYKSSVDPLKAYLFFEASPDRVEVKCWDEGSWDNPSAVYEVISVTVSDSEMADREGEKDFTFSLKDGSYIYEVIAEWTSHEMYGGTVYYSFYTTSPYVTVYPIDNVQN